MVSKIRVVLLAVATLLLVLLLSYWWGTPRLLKVSPSDGATAVPAGMPLRLTFSRPMQGASVIERLSITPPITGAFSWEGKELVFMPDQPWLAGENVQVALEAGSRAAGWLPLSLRQAKVWSFTIGQPRLVYLYPANDLANLFILDPLKGESKPLTGDSGVLDFCVNSSGTAIYYSVRSAQGGSEIRRLDLVGETMLSIQQDSEQPADQPAPVLVLACTDALCRAPAISPAEDFLAYERTPLPGSGQPEIPQVWYLPLPAVNHTGSNSFPIPQENSALAGDSANQALMPQWSPDGSLTFYDDNDQAFIVWDPHTGERMRFPNQTGQPGSWHPDGKSYVAAEISFIDSNVSPELTELQSLANSHLIAYHVDGTEEDLTQIEVMEDASPAYSPDGNSLAFARKFLDVKLWTPGRQLWLMQMTSGETQPLTNDPLYNHYDFAWSPTGNLLAFVRFNQTILTEPTEIWLLDLATGQPARLLQGGYAPQWIP